MSTEQQAGAERVATPTTAHDASPPAPPTGTTNGSGGRTSAHAAGRLALMLGARRCVDVEQAHSPRLLLNAVRDWLVHKGGSTQPSWDGGF